MTLLEESGSAPTMMSARTRTVNKKSFRQSEQLGSADTDPSAPLLQGTVPQIPGGSTPHTTGVSPSAQMVIVSRSAVGERMEKVTRYEEVRREYSNHLNW